MHLDVATGGELHVALAAGVPAERLVLHGNNKSHRRAAPGPSTAGVGPHRGRQLRRARPPRPRSHAADGRRAAGAAPGHARRRGPHPRVRAHRPGRLEVRLRRCRPAPPPRRSTRAAGARRRSSSSASTCTSAARCSSPTSSTRPSRSSPRSSRELGLPELSIGGGLGVAYVEGEEAPTIAAVGQRRCARRAATPASTARVAAEPGRAIVAAAAVTLYTVGTIKELPGVRTYVVGRRRHERQPPAGALRQRLRDVPAPGRRRRPAPHASRSWASTASRATCWCATRRCPPTWPSATCWPRRSPAPTATRWAPTTTRCPGPPVVFVRRRRGPRGRPPRDLRRPPPPRRAADRRAGAVDGRPYDGAVTTTTTVRCASGCSAAATSARRSCELVADQARRHRGPHRRCASRSPGSPCASLDQGPRPVELPDGRAHQRRRGRRRRPRRSTSSSRSSAASSRPAS